MNKNRRDFIVASGSVVAGYALSPIAAYAQRDTYPDRMAKIYVPFSPGAATDIIARFVAKVLDAGHKQSFVVENRSGGGSVIGTRAVSAAAPDGYTLGMIDTTFVINPGLLGDSLPYDTQKDFAPISLIATAPLALVVHPSVDATDVKSFVALAKAKPGTLTFGSAGIGSAPHLAGEQLRREAKIDVVHAPYRGGSSSLTDLLGGHIQFLFGTVPTLTEHIKAGRLRALAVTTKERVAQLPNVPTMTESGYPGVDTMPLFGLVTTGKTPKPIVDKLSGVVRTSVRSGELRGELIGLGFVPVGSTPDEFAAQISSDIRKWTTIIREGNIKPE
jgi:tripartite-type tricarboxylate transporter receptor subunit TctC